MAKSQVPGTQNVRVRACQSPQNQSLAAGKQIGTIQVPRTGLARTISITRPRDLAILLRTWPGTDEQKFFSKSNFVPGTWNGHLPKSKCPAGHPNVRPRTQIGTWDILTKFDLEKNFCPTVPVHVLRRMAKSQVPGTQNVRVRTCQSSLNQLCGCWKADGIVPYPSSKDWPSSDNFNQTAPGLGYSTQDMAWNR